MDKDLLYRFFEGHASLEDMKVVKEWAGASEENAGLLRRERKLFNAMILAGHSRRTDIQRMRNRRNYFIREFLKIASVIVITVSVTAVLFSIGKDNGGMYLAMQTITVPAGQRVNLDLPDGSNVWLNAGTTMQYPVSFMTDKREVILDGEAYFEVAHNEKSPFVVHTSTLDVEVLGTKFNFKNYSNDEEVMISLVEGKVALQNGIKAMEELYLEPNERMVLNKLTGEMVKSKANVEYANIWRDNKLFFDEELLEDIAKKLMRSYDVRIEVADSLRDRRFYGDFMINKNTIEEVLETIASTSRMNYRYENGKYILY